MLSLKNKKLCEKYGKECIITFDEDREVEVKKKSKFTEKTFIKEVKNAKTKQKIIGLYRMLNNYNNQIVLKEYSSWQTLIKKTFEIYGNISPFLKLLKDNNFPHTDYWSSNSKYFHFGLAAALKEINTKQETVKEVFKDAGHGGFINVMKAYEVNKNKKLCSKLFERYLNFCYLLVN